LGTGLGPVRPDLERGIAELKCNRVVACFVLGARAAIQIGSKLWLAGFLGSFEAGIASGNFRRAGERFG